MKRTLIKYFLVLVLGTIFGAIVMTVIYDSLVSQYINERLERHEVVSKDAFLYRREVINRLAQTDYLVMLKNTYEFGFLGDAEFQRRSAIANMRVCIKDKIGRSKKFQHFCEWAREHWSKARQSRNFEAMADEQKRMLEESLRKNETSAEN